MNLFKKIFKKNSRPEEGGNFFSEIRTNYWFQTKKN